MSLEMAAGQISKCQNQNLVVWNLFVTAVDAIAPLEELGHIREASTSSIKLMLDWTKKFFMFQKQLFKLKGS